jgi:dihydrofolate reductase
MATVVADMSMSLDGFVAGPGDDVAQVFSWMADIDEASAEALQAADVRALVIGRRTFDLAHGWGGQHPVGAPVWIPTHHPPEGWDDAPFTFVTDGVEAAVGQARAHAGEGIVGVAGANVVGQCLNAGLLDAVRMSVVPYLLGGGIPYFGGLEAGPVRLGPPEVVEGRGVIHLHYEVLK